MDIRLGLSLLLLLAHAVVACSKTSRDGPTNAAPRAAHPPPPPAPPQHQQHHVHHRPHRQVPHRQTRGLSEFLLPPPAPANFRGPRGPHPPHIQQHPKNPGNHNQPPLPPPPPPPQQTKHTRNGRYVNQQGGQGSISNNGPGYFSKLMSWLNPFGNGNGNNNNNNGEIVAKDSHSQGASNYPLHQQYAPQMPYGAVTAQYQPPPHPANLQGSGGYSNLVAWMNGKPCNPCNQIPWIPVLNESPQSSLNQYAPSAGHEGYLAPPPPQEVQSPDFVHPAIAAAPHPGNQPNFPIPNPHLYAGAIPPLFKAKPFNDVPGGYGPPEVEQPPLPNFNHQRPSNFDHQPSLNLDPQPPPQFDHQGSAGSDHQPPRNVGQGLSSYGTPPAPLNFDHPSTSNFDHPPQSNFDHSAPSNFDRPPQLNFDHSAPSNFDRPPQSNFDHPPQSNFDHPPQSNFDHPPQSNFDHPPQSTFNHAAPSNFDHQPSNFNNGLPQNYNPSPNFNYQSPPNSDHPPSNFEQHPSQSFEDHPPPEYEHAPSSNYDYQSPNYDNHPSSNYDDSHPSSNIEQHHQSSQIVDVVTEPPSDLDHSDVSHNHEPDHAESRPVYVNSATSTSAPNRPYSPQNPQFPPQNVNTIVHFQRSPLIDLSVAGESSSSTSTTTTTSTTTASTLNRFPERQPTEPPASKGKEPPAASVIDYIVSSPAFGSSETEKETRPPPQQQRERNVPQSVTTTTTTKTTTVVVPEDQRRQEAMLETLVQSYEFFKNRNVTGMKEGKAGGRMFNETDDFSASKEVVGPNKIDNGKKIIQIIIPYTSQYTPSPFHPTRAINGHARHEDTSASASFHHPVKTEPPKHQDVSGEDNVVSEESRRVSVVQSAPGKLRNSNKTELAMVGKMGNAIDVHRLQKNIDNWTIQEYSKATTSVSNNPNSTYPRWLSSKQIPDEYLLSAKELEESSEYYDFSNETELHRGTNRSEATSSESTAKVKIINATYPKKPKKSEYPLKESNLTASSSERVYVVTPVPNPNSLEDLSSEKSSRARKPKHQERAYQVLPEAVNNLAVLSAAPESAAPALWGIMEHEEFATGVEQPRWRSESDALPEPASTPILYTGHSKVSRAR